MKFFQRLLHVCSSKDLLLKGHHVGKAKGTRRRACINKDIRGKETIAVLFLVAKQVVTGGLFPPVIAPRS